MKKQVYLFLFVGMITIGHTLSANAVCGEPGISSGNAASSLLISYVTSRGDAKTVVVEFNAVLNKATAENTSNYIINNDVTVSEARLAWDQKTVILTTSTLSERNYILTVQNIQDQEVAPNTIDPVNIIFTHKSFGDGIVAFYNLDTLVIVEEDTMVYDASLNLNNGKGKNGVYITGGLLGNALGFDGVDDYVEYQTSASFDMGTEAVTVSLWAKLDYLPSELPYAHGPLWDSESDQYVLYEDQANLELRFKVVTSDGAERPGIPEADLVTNQWIHLAGVYDGSSVMIYLNGVVKDTHPLTGTVNAGQMATLGKNISSGAYFSGSIDQIEIYNVALNEAEVNERYNLKAVPVAMYPVSVIVPAAQPDFCIFPNPNNGLFTLDLNSASHQYARVEVINSLGKVIYREELNNIRKKTIQVPSAPTGLYILKVTTNNEVLKQNMIIK